jgi:hypothetical protein
MAHTHNTSNLGGGHQEDHVLRSACAKSVPVILALQKAQVGGLQSEVCPG